MKTTTFILIIASSITFSMVSCKHATPKGQKETSTETPKVQKAMDVNGLFHVAEQRVLDTITVQGIVKHTCAHSGRRCFVADSTGNVTIRVESGGNIQSFNKELVNNEIIVTGVLHEKRLSQEYIDQWEKKLATEEQKGEKDSEHCNSEKNNILQMREWMKKNNKDFYAIYYVNGIDYKIVK